MPKFPPIVTASMASAALVIMCVGAFVFGLDDATGWILVGVGAAELIFAAVLFLNRDKDGGPKIGETRPYPGSDGLIINGEYQPGS